MKFNPSKVQSESLAIFALIIIIFVFFAHTLGYPWKHFDEQIIYNETIYPIALSLEQVFEYIQRFGLNAYFEASSPFYSSISNLRSDPANTLITLFVYFFFQKNAFLFHLLSLILHIINSCLLFLLINKIAEEFIKTYYHKRIFTTFILSLCWALNPVNIEAILFTTNWGSMLSYSFCTFIIYYFINFNLKNNSVINSFVIFFLFLIPVFSTEYSCTLPIILFFYTYAHSQNLGESRTFLTSLAYSLKKCFPVFIPLLLFILYFFSSHTNQNHTFENSISVTNERIFWLSPQIYFHFLKLILFPLHLSIDQISMVKLSKSFFEPYSIFCTLLLYSTIFISVISFMLIRKKMFYFLFILISLFLVAMLPFLHIFSPAYCLASERYLYFPTLILTFSIAHLIFFIFSKTNTKTSNLIIVTLLSVLVLYSTRSFIRTFDWKDSEALFASSLKTTSNPLFKGLRTGMLGSLLTNKDLNTSIAYTKEAIQILENYILELKEIEKIHSNNFPEILKIYGLDPRTLQAKAAYLLVYTRLGLNLDLKEAYMILKPYMESKSIIDTQILDLYSGILVANNDLDKAEELIKSAIQRKISPAILIILSEIYKQKYNDLTKAENLLQKSFKLFPYDPQTLESLKQLYLLANKPNEFAWFSYLHGIRVHSKESLENAYNIFIRLNNSEMANNALKNIRLINERTNTIK